YNTAYVLCPAYSPGYTLDSWVKDSGAVGTFNSTSATYTIGDGTNAATITGKASTYAITLNGNGATNSYTTSTTATYYSTTLGAITTLPQRIYTLSSFSATGDASGATITYPSSGCTSASNCKSTYTFKGWYKEPAATTQVASSAATPALTASNGYTDSSKRWTSTSAQTLYAGWTGQSVTLPTISKTGYTCSWKDQDNNSIASGGSVTPTKNLTITGVCTVNSYSVKVNFAGSGVSSVTFAASGYTSRSVTTSGGTASLTYNVPYTMTMAFTPGYEFESWALNSTNYGTLSSISDNPATFTIKASNDGIITATGKQSCTPISGTMQAFVLTPSTCTSGTLTDSRDNQTYTVAKLADGNVWMVDNLNLGATTLSSDLTSANTNLSTTISASTFNSYKKTGGTATRTAAEYISLSSTDDTSQTPHGTLYNYCAASAGTICTDSNSSNAQYDICPKGWRLPTGGSSGEFQALYNIYNTNAKMRAPISQGGAAFALAGIFLNGAPQNRGSIGHYWSSTRYDNTNMYVLYLYASNVDPADNDYRNYGNSIRCVLKPTMQGFTAAEAVAMATGETKTLRDSRDGQDYTVAKLADGNVWMTQNLRFTGTSINSSTTNINTTKTLSYGDLTSGNSYTEPRIHNSGNATTGVWYNYCAASAGTICTDSNSTETSFSLCPAGWRLPTKTEQSGITSYSSAFSPVTGGRYNYGNLLNTNNGFWWSSTANNGTGRYSLFYNGSSIRTSNDDRSYGIYVRCVLDTRTSYEKLQAGALSMQDIGNLSSAESTTLLSQMAENTQYNVLDSRDGQGYTVAKLPDGNVWMTKNLNLAGGTALTPADSNVSAGCNLGNNCTLPVSSTSGFSIDSTAYVYNSGSTTCGDGSPCYSYYSYVAATAGTGASISSGNATSDICPKGWRLPVKSEYETLIGTYNTGSKLTASPFLGVYGGYYNGSTFYYGGTGGYYWSSTASGSTTAYYMGFGSSEAAMGSGGKRSGNSARCILQ
ncbi:hypothetical protein IKG24_02340, partial [Candidatus Saccharibacteria bacterium]|nr:hypothetical protein [Candidatus Saccharibacteria bacterium]